jgi:hypothetical protein
LMARAGCFQFGVGGRANGSVESDSNQLSVFIIFGDSEHCFAAPCVNTKAMPAPIL